MSNEVKSTRGHWRGKGGQPDLVAVERAVAGTTPIPRLVTQELRLAIAELGRRGLTPAQIARQIGCSSRTACRHLRAMRG